MTAPRFTRATTPALVLALAFGAGACGGSDSNASSGDAQPTATATATASSSGGSAASTIAVKEAEFSLQPTPATAKAGKVTFDVKNAGAIKHEFVVIKTSKQADALLKGEEADKTGAVDEIGDIPAGQTKQLTVKLKPGHYALICNLPGHYMPGGKDGMLADLTVQ